MIERARARCAATQLSLSMDSNQYINNAHSEYAILSSIKCGASTCWWAAVRGASAVGARRARMHSGDTRAGAPDGFAYMQLNMLSTYNKTNNNNKYTYIHSSAYVTQ